METVNLKEIEKVLRDLESTFTSAGHMDQEKLQIYDGQLRALLKTHGQQLIRIAEKK